MLKRFAVIAAFVLALVSPGLGADQKITIAESLQLADALAALDGHDRIAEGGKVVKERYKFGGAVLLAIARNITVLKATVENFGMVRNALIREIGGDAGTVKPDTPEMARLTTELTKVLKTAETISFVRIKVADLDLEKNQIPPTVLAALSPVLDY